LEVTNVRVTKPDGNVVVAGADAVKELSTPIQKIAPVYTDYREKHVTVPGLRPGDLLECRTVTLVQTPLAAGEFWIQYDFQKSAIVLDEQLEIDIPASRTIKLKTGPNAEAKITEENGRRVYRWSSSHLVSENQENLNAPKKKKKTTDETPAVQLTSFSSWEEVGSWYAGLERDRRVPSAAVRAKAQELVKGLTNDFDKVQALYDYTALNFRYVSLSLGTGRYQPHSADEVLRNQYGDCKDKNTLLAALLEAGGFHASSVLIHSARKLDPDVPSPAQFNHVITMVPVGKEEVWLDTTTEVAPFRLLAYPLRKKQALVIPPQGVSHLEETPADSAIPDTEKLQIEGKVDDSGALDAKIAYEIRGDSELVLRKAFRSMSSGQWREVIEGISSQEGFGKNVSEIKVSDPTATREPFTFSYHVTKADYLDPSKKKLEMKFPLPVLGLADADPEDADGVDPVKLGPPNTRDYRVRLGLPVRYTIGVPLSVSVKRDFSNYEAAYKLDGNTVTAERRFSIAVSEIPSSRVQDYLAYKRAVLADLSQQVSLETTAAGNRASSADMKPDELMKKGNEALKDGNDKLAIDLLKRAAEADPKSNGAWNDLGLAYFDAHQDDLAVSAFQKQVDINPYHPFSYNNMGRVYARQRKYDEAIKWFRKQIEIDPLDKYAHSNLGIVYLEQHQYGAAIPELEKAVSLNPDNAGSQVRLGEAYLNTGQDEKAMSAFDEAVEISASPGIWNDIAYQLALKRAHLDIARRYAESAVTTEMTRLRNFSLEQLTSRNIGYTSSLASFWDTLGWVEFADGNLEKAQKYLLAAWQLSQRADAADHLAQIYQKRGDTSQAIHFYALALNARRPDPDTRARFATLAGGDDKLEPIIEQNRDELLRQRTLEVQNPLKQSGTAEFFVLLANRSTSEMTADDTKFISGDENLKGFADPLRILHYSQSSPDDTPFRLLRRGTLSCGSANANCTFLLTLPVDVRSVE